MVIVGKFKQRLSWVILFCAVILILFPVFAENQYKKFTDEDNGYSIEYLAQWQVIQSQYADGGTHFVDASNNPPIAAVNVNKVKTSQSIAEIANATENYILSQAGVSNVRILNEDKISVLELKGVVKLISYTLNGNQSLVKTAYLGNEQSVITVSMAGSGNVLDEQASVFDYMLESIEFL